MSATVARNDGHVWGQPRGVPGPAGQVSVTIDTPAPTQHRLLTQLALGVTLVVALTLWVVSLQGFQMDRIDGLGLASAAPVTYWIAGAVVLLGFGGLLATERPSIRWGLLYLAVLIVVLHATPGIIEAHPRFPTAWTHVGFVDHIIEHGTVEPTYDARFNWPGAFSLGAYVTELAGLESSRALIRWAPVCMNLLALGSLVYVARQVTRDRRIQLAAACIALLFGWVGQDYLAPQAVALIAYLTVIGVMLHHFGPPGGGPVAGSLLGRLARRFPGLARQQNQATLSTPPHDLGPVRGTALFTVVLVVAGVLSFSHQLTPFVLAAAAFALVVLGRVDRPLLPLAILVLAVSWVTFGATTFLESNIEPLVANVGAVGSAIDENVGDRTGGSPARDVVLIYRLALTAALGALAALGTLRQWRARRVDWAVVALALLTAPLLALNSYGGEVLLRAVLFATPFLALLAAFACFREGAPHRRRRKVAAFTVVSLLAFPALVVARYGNESFEQIRSSDIAAWDHVTAIAEADTRVVVLNFAGPWRYSDLLGTDYRVYPDEVSGDPTPEGVRTMLQDGGSGSLLLLGASGALHGTTFNGADPSWQEDLAADLLARPGFDEVFRDGPSRIIEWNEPDGRGVG